MNKLIALIKNNWLALTLVSVVTVTISSLWPVDQLPQVPGTDKLHHVIAYAMVMFPIALRRPERWVWFGLLVVAYSGGIELVQPYMNRYAEWLDLLANSAGVVSAVVIAELINRVFPSQQNSQNGH